jgi:hypothetical protein
LSEGTLQLTPNAIAEALKRRRKSRHGRQGPTLPLMAWSSRSCSTRSGRSRDAGMFVPAPESLWRHRLRFRTPARIRAG